MDLSRRYTVENTVSLRLAGVTQPNQARAAPKIQQQLERLSQLPRARQRVASEVLDSLLAQSR